MPKNECYQREQQVLSMNTSLLSELRNWEWFDVEYAVPDRHEVPETSRSLENTIHRLVFSLAGERSKVFVPAALIAVSLECSLERFDVAKVREALGNLALRRKLVARWPEGCSNV